MYKQRLIDNKRREPEFWFEVKKVWLKIMYKENWGKISKRYFFEHFSELCKKYGIEWNFKDKEGNPKIPNLKDYEYANKNSCFKKYEWDECFEQYENDRITDAEKKAKKTYKKKVYERVLKKLDQLDQLDKHEDKLLKEQENGKNHEDKILKTEKAMRDKERGIKEDLGLNDDKKITLEGNINSNMKATVDLNNNLTPEELREKDEAYIRQFIKG